MYKTIVLGFWALWLMLLAGISRVYSTNPETIIMVAMSGIFMVASTWQSNNTTKGK